MYDKIRNDPMISDTTFTIKGKILSVISPFFGTDEWKSCKVIHFMSW